MKKQKKPLISRSFDRRAYSFCLHGLRGIGRQIPDRAKITPETVATNNPIVLGDIMIGHVPSEPSFYHIDHNDILGRCILPFTDGLAWFEGSYGLAHQMGWVIDLVRLQNIKQLSVLCLPVQQDVLAEGFNHNRLLHTMDVYAIGLICAHNLGVVGKDLDALRIALLIHDLFTSSFGDLMKFVDFKRYDEDAQLTRLLRFKSYLNICDYFGVDPKEPIRICQQKEGLLCNIRDFADTYAYTARDLSQFLELQRTYPDNWYVDKNDQEILRSLWDLMKSGLRMTLWESIKSNDSGDLVFSDHRKLYEFLFIRACLFRLLYYHPQTRNIEYLIGVRLVKILLGSGFLTPEQFEDTTLGDDCLWSKIYAEVGYNPAFLHSGNLGYTEKFDDLKSAQRFVREKTGRNKCGLIYTWPSATKSKVGYWKVNRCGNTDACFDEVYPRSSKEIEEIMNVHSGYFVSIFNRSCMHQLKQEYWDHLKSLEQSAL